MPKTDELMDRLGNVEKARLQELELEKAYNKAVRRNFNGAESGGF